MNRGCSYCKWFKGQCLNPDNMKLEHKAFGDIYIFKRSFEMKNKNRDCEDYKRRVKKWRKS